MPAFPGNSYTETVSQSGNVYDVPNTIAELVTAGNAQAANNGVPPTGTPGGTITGSRLWAMNFSQVFADRGDLVQPFPDAVTITGYEKSW